MERAQQGLLERLVSFDQSELRATQTTEKNILPTQEGGKKCD